jgi:diadenosine tetraphosphate (Ap4A) HIT family hydrolase
VAYDDQNIFAKILRGEIPCKKVYENEFALAFHDIQPQMPVHVLVIPKGPWVTIDEFEAGASNEQMGGFMRAIAKAAEIAGVATSGYRLVFNNGADANQEIPHVHAHILGGRRIRARMIRED